jgi:hypothetical protein
MIAMRNKRSFQSFGTLKMITEDVQELQSEEYFYLNEEYNTYYVWDSANWEDIYTSESLTNFKPPSINFKFYE